MNEQLMYERIVVMDAVLRTRLDAWYFSAKRALEMAEHHSRLAKEATEAGDREAALSHLEACKEWAEKL